MTSEAHSLLNHLCSMPEGHGTLATKDLKGLLLETGGQVMARGRLYDIASKLLGAGVYRVSLRARQGAQDE